MDTVYVMSEVGEAYGFWTFDEFNDVVGSQSHASPTPPGNEVPYPVQISMGSYTCPPGAEGTTVNCMVCVSLQPNSSLTVTVYPVVTFGEAETEGSEGSSNPPGGNHEYSTPPEATS